MASVPSDKLSAPERDQLAICYASFVLSGAGSEVNADSLNAVLKAAGITANPNLVNAVAKALKGKDVKEFFGAVSGGAPAPAAEKAASKPAEKAK